MPDVILRPGVVEYYTSGDAALIPWAGMDNILAHDSSFASALMAGLGQPGTRMLKVSVFDVSAIPPGSVISRVVINFSAFCDVGLALPGTDFSIGGRLDGVDVWVLKSMTISSVESLISGDIIGGLPSSYTDIAEAFFNFRVTRPVSRPEGSVYVNDISLTVTWEAGSVGQVIPMFMPIIVPSVL